MVSFHHQKLKICNSNRYDRPITVAARSKGWICCRSLARIVVTNPARGRVSVPYVCCVLSEVAVMGRSVSRRVLPSLVCLSVIWKLQQ